MRSCTRWCAWAPLRLRCFRRSATAFAELAAAASQSGSPAPVAPDPGARPDVPVVRAAPRASLAAALAAAAPAARQAALSDLDANVMAASSRGPRASRVSLWRTLAESWGVQPWPVALECLRAVAASLRAGAYRSAEQYFSAAFMHQERELRTPVDPVVRRAAKGFVRSIRRGLSGSRLKESFDRGSWRMWCASTPSIRRSTPSTPTAPSTPSSSPSGSCCARSRLRRPGPSTWSSTTPPSPSSSLSRSLSRRRTRAAPRT